MTRWRGRRSRKIATPAEYEAAKARFLATHAAPGRAHDVEFLAPSFSSVVVRPGDRLVLFTGTRLTDADMARLTEQLTGHLDGVRVAVVEDVDGFAVYRPGEPDQSE
ncbi:hypothetical protein D7231_31865 [Streptomyces klenkii]|uniref:Uncharacterized protein n=1 Tax=Streptomyces klenkii TaxID=1420899 RepID=A0A3B0AN70_9ACTN|nr:hypothetical protein [Streptomyces klenkii]RKN61871.1 hypothetical protein D7231_31865 [Streptomyces klenkii]